jgi:hypothetical protein
VTSEQKKIIEDEFIDDNGDIHQRQYDEETGEVEVLEDDTKFIDIAMGLGLQLCVSAQSAMGRMNPVVLVVALIAVYVMCLNVGDPVVNSIDNQGICLLEMRDFNGLAPTFRELELEEIVDRIHKCGRAFEVDTSRLAVAGK